MRCHHRKIKKKRWRILDLKKLNNLKQEPGSALLFFLDYLLYNFFADQILYYRIQYFYFVAVALANTVYYCFLL